MKIKGRLSYDKLSLDDKNNIIDKYYNTNYNFNKLADTFSYCFGLLGTEVFLNNIAIKMNFGHVKILRTKTEEIKELRICAKCELLKIFNYLYDGSTIYLDRKYNKWLEIMSAFAM